MQLYQPSITGSLSVSGSLLVNGPITLTSGTLSGTASLANTASYAINADTLDGYDSSVFVQTGSFNTASGSFSTRVAAIEGNYITTGSNTFIGNQTITGSVLQSGSLSVNGCIVSTGQIVAQTINVQQVTSSIVYSCGSNTFGTAINNTQTLTGSVFITGSSVAVTATTSSFSGNVGIGALNPRWQLEICNDTTCTGAGLYPAVSVNNPNIAGYSGLYFYKDTCQMGGVEYSNSTCTLLMNSRCTISLQTQNVDRLVIHDGIVKVNLNKACNIGGGALNLNGDLRFGGVGGQNYCVINYQGGCLQLGTNNAPYLTIGLNGSTTLSCQLYLDGCNRDTVFVKSDNTNFARLFYAGNNSIVFHNGGTTANGGAWGLNNYEDTAGLFRVYNSGTSCWFGPMAVCGNIGITCTSAKFFMVTNNCKSSDSVLDIYNTATNGYGVFIQGGADSNNYALSVTNYLQTPLLHVAGNGFIGIGCTAPQAKLTINNGSCIGAIHIYGSNSSYTSQVGFYDSSNVNPNSDGVGGQRIALIEIGTVAGSGTGCRGANMALYTHEANGSLKLPLLLMHTGNVCLMQGNLYTTCTLFAPGTPIQIVTGTATVSSGAAGTGYSMGPGGSGTTPGYNCGIQIAATSFTPKSSTSKLLIMTNNVAMWERTNVSDHFYLWAANTTDGTMLVKSGQYLQNFGPGGQNGGIISLNGTTNSWGTTSKSISFRIGTTGGDGPYYEWNPYYGAGGFSADTVGHFSYTIMEIAQ